MDINIISYNYEIGRLNHNPTRDMLRLLINTNASDIVVSKHHKVGISIFSSNMNSN